MAESYDPLILELEESGGPAVANELCSKYPPAQLAKLLEARRGELAWRGRWRRVAPLLMLEIKLRVLLGESEQVASCQQLLATIHQLHLGDAERAKILGGMPYAAPRSPFPLSPKTSRPVHRGYRFQHQGENLGLRTRREFGLTLRQVGGFQTLWESIGGEREVSVGDERFDGCFAIDIANPGPFLAALSPGLRAELLGLYDDGLHVEQDVWMLDQSLSLRHASWLTLAGCLEELDASVDVSERIYR